MPWNDQNLPPWKATEIHGFWEVTTDRGDPSDEFDVTASGDEEVIRLAAAAPALLAACEATLDWLNDAMVNPDELSQDAKEIRATVHAAIALAKGQS